MKKAVVLLMLAVFVMPSVSGLGSMLTVLPPESEEEDNPFAPIKVIAKVTYDLWHNKWRVRVSWQQSGGPEPALEVGKWALVEVDGKMIGTYKANSTVHVLASWSFLDGGEHTLSVKGAVAVVWPTLARNQTYFSALDTIQVDNFPRWLMFVAAGSIVFVVAMAIIGRAVRKERDRREEGNEREG